MSPLHSCLPHGLARPHRRAAAGLPRRGRGFRTRRRRAHGADRLLRHAVGPLADAVAVLSSEAARVDATAFDTPDSGDELTAKDEADVAADIKVLALSHYLHVSGGVGVDEVNEEEEESAMAMPVDAGYSCDEFEFKVWLQRRWSAGLEVRVGQGPSLGWSEMGTADADCREQLICPTAEDLVLGADGATVGCYGWRLTQ